MNRIYEIRISDLIILSSSLHIPPLSQHPEGEHAHGIECQHYQDVAEEAHFKLLRSSLLFRFLRVSHIAHISIAHSEFKEAQDMKREELRMVQGLR